MIVHDESISHMCCMQEKGETGAARGWVTFVLVSVVRSRSSIETGREYGRMSAKREGNEKGERLRAECSGGERRGIGAESDAVRPRAAAAQSWPLCWRSTCLMTSER